MIPHLYRPDDEREETAFRREQADWLEVLGVLSAAEAKRKKDNKKGGGKNEKNP